MKKLTIFTTIILFFIISAYADLIKITASADGSNNSTGKFLEYQFYFDIDETGFRINADDSRYDYVDYNVNDYFYAHYDGPFHLPYSDVDPVKEYSYGWIIPNTTTSFLTMGYRGNTLVVIGNDIANWQTGTSLNGIEGQKLLNGKSNSIRSTLTITGFEHVSSTSVPEPSTVPLIISGFVVLCAGYSGRRKTA